MTQNMFSSLLTDLWSDLSEPGLLWQIMVLVWCAAAGWGLARFLRARVRARNLQSGVVRLGMESFSRVLPPALALSLLAIITPIFSHWHRANVLRVAIPLVASFALIRLAFYVLNRVFSHQGKAGGFLQLFEKVFAAIVWIGVALYITGLWPDLVAYLEETTLPIGRHRTSLLIILQAAASVVVTLMLALWAGALLEERLMRMESVHSSLRTIMARMGKAVLILTAVLLSLSLVGIDLTALSVFGGALGVGIGLGLQKIVSSYVSGFVILLERSLSIGDVVAIDKYQGQVTQINTRYTIVRSGDGIETVVPNEMLVLGAVQNYSLTDRILRLTTNITIGYQYDIERVLELMQDAAICVKRVSRNPIPQALLLKFEADGFLVELSFWISDPENGRTNVLSEVNRAIWKTLQNHHIDLPYPQREIRIIDAKEKVEDAFNKADEVVNGPVVYK
jgi:small-conductance mechanosensitive channel